MLFLQPNFHNSDTKRQKKRGVPPEYDARQSEKYALRVQATKFPRLVLLVPPTRRWRPRALEIFFDRRFARLAHSETFLLLGASAKDAPGLLQTPYPTNLKRRVRRCLQASR